MELQGLTIPRKILAERVAGFSCAAPVLFTPSPAWNHLDRYLSMLIDSDTTGDPALYRQIENHIIDLIVLSLGASEDSAALAKMRGLRAARLRDIVAEIETRFDDCSFATDNIAKKMRLSRRHINEILLETGSTFSQRAPELRPQKARTLLFDARYDKMRISSIAFACGFTEVSYFNRRFRARFGCSPIQYRGGYG